MALLTDSQDSDLKSELVQLCRKALTPITLDPGIRILNVEVESLISARFGFEKPERYYLVSIDTNDASMLRGKARSLKGSYKERLEGILDHYAKRLDPTTSVFVEVRGPESNSVERLIPLPEMMLTGKLSDASPIVRAAKANQIQYIQIRGRHLIAPSPAIAEFLETYGRNKAADIRSVVDLFAGTAVATKVLDRVAHPERVTVVENDPAKLENCRRHVRNPVVEFLLADAMSYSFENRVSLVVADPYYEDVEEFLKRQLKKMAARVDSLLLVPGNVEDRIWNDRMARMLRQAGYQVQEHALYGQVILEASLLRPRRS